MRKKKRPDDDVYRLTGNCREALDKLFDMIQNKPAAYHHFRECLNEIEKLSLWIIEEQGGNHE